MNYGLLTYVLHSLICSLPTSCVSSPLALPSLTSSPSAATPMYLSSRSHGNLLLSACTIRSS